MEEEAYAGIRKPLAQESGKEQQLIVVDPDEVARPILLCYDLGKAVIHLGIRLPIADVQRNLIQQIMKERPENAVGEALVIPGDLVGGERNRYQPHLGQLPVQLGLLRSSQPLRRTRPADPESARLLVRPEESSREPTSTALDLHPRLTGSDGDWQSVGDDQDSRHAGRYPTAPGKRRVAYPTLARPGRSGLRPGRPCQDPPRSPSRQAPVGPAPSFVSLRPATRSRVSSAGRPGRWPE